MDEDPSMQVQAVRLRRAVEGARAHKDLPAFTSLSGELRPWTEVREDDIAGRARMLRGRRWKTASIAGRYRKVMRAYDAVAAVFPHPVAMHLPGEHEMASSGLYRAGGATNIVAVYAGDRDGNRAVTAYAEWRSTDTGNDPTPDLENPGRFAQGLLANYHGWLDTDAVLVSGAHTGKSGTVRSLSRQQLIKRVANAFGGSHLLGGEPWKGDDELINKLMAHRVLGVPIPYFFLLSAADQILHAFGIPIPEVRRAE